MLDGFQFRRVSSQAVRISGRIALEIYEWTEAIVGAVPGLAGSQLRSVFYRCSMSRVGPHFRVGIRSRIQCPSAVSVGGHTSINDNVWIAANPDPLGCITVGSNVLIGPSVIIHSGNHLFADASVPINVQGHQFAPITIEDDVWIAARATILAGVTVATGTVVAAGAVVTRSTEPYSIVAGVPARQVGIRLGDS